MSGPGALLAEREYDQPSCDNTEVGFVSEKRTEGSFDYTDFGGGGVDTGECTPIVDDETSTNHIGTSVHRTGL